MTTVAEPWTPPWTPVPAAFWDGIRRLIAPYVIGSFTVPGNPQPKERPRLGAGGHTITPARTVVAEQRVHDAFRDSMPNWEPEPDGTYGILIQFNTEEGSTADLDNVTKLVWDALNTNRKPGKKRRDGLWEDDIQVGMALLRLVRYGDPGAVVWVFGLENNGTPLTAVCECGTRYRSRTMKACFDCRKRNKAIADLMRDDVSEQDAAELAQLKRRAFSFITACTIGNGRSPSVKAVAERLAVPESRARAVVDALIAGGNIKRLPNRQLQVIKPLGDAA